MARIFRWLRRAFTFRTLIILISIILLIVVVWLIGPRLQIEGAHPLASLEARALLSALIIAVPLAIYAFRYWRVRRARQRALRDLSKAGQLATVADTDAGANIEELREQLEAALTALKQTAGAGSYGRNFAYEVPCYILIGAPGSGKTVLLHGSGLRTPLAQNVPTAGFTGAFEGAKSCRFWVAEDAIFVDLPGRSFHGTWRSLLELFKEYRPRRPLNGVVVTISAEELLTANAEERRTRASALKHSLQEMLAFLGVTLPIYVVITKTDLISGFAEFFDFLPIEARRQIWGISLPADFDAARARAASALAVGFHELLDRVSARRAEALSHEHDLSRRERIFGFPEQLGSLFPLLCQVIADVFGSARNEATPQLRGVFLTSGTQSDWALDRVFAQAAASINLSPVRKVPALDRGGPFFINGLFTRFILPESGLAGLDSRLERRTARASAFGWATAIVLVLLMTAIWGYTFHVGGKKLAQDRVDAEHLLTAERSLQPGASVAQALPVLNQAAMLANRYDMAEIIYFAQGGGLSASADVGPHADAMYERVLFAELMPRLMRELETRLRAETAGSSQDALREDLKIYLMMGEPEHFQRDRVVEWFRNHWAKQYSLQPAVGSGLQVHLGALMASMPQAQALDDRVVSSARAALGQTPAAQQIYATLQREAAADSSLTPFRLADALGPQAVLSLTATGPAGLRAEIPGFYTRNGFETYILDRLPRLLGDLVKTDWVMGSAPAASNSKVSGLADQVAALYGKDYVARWQQLVDSLRLRSFTDLQSTMKGLDNLSGVNSPLTQLIAAISANTDLKPPQSAQANGSGATADEAANAVASGRAGSLTQSARSLADAATATSTATLFTTWPGDHIRSPFAPIIALGDASGGATAPIDQVRALIAGAAGMLQSVATAPSPAAAAYKTALSQSGGGAGNAISVLRAQASTYPGVIAKMLDAAASDASAALNGLAGSYIAAAWRDSDGGRCAARIAGRFPIDRSAGNEIALNDFKNFFGPGGVMDGFQKKYVRAFATSGQGGSGSSGQAVIDAATLGSFRQADRIRAAFFNGGQLQVNYSLTPTSLDPRALQVKLEIGSDQLVYRHESPRRQQMVWPSGGSGLSYALMDLKRQAHNQTLSGDWALFRLVDQAGKADPGDKSVIDISLSVDKLTASYQVNTNSLASAFDSSVTEGFKCPDM